MVLTTPGFSPRTIHRLYAFLAPKLNAYDNNNIFRIAPSQGFKNNHDSPAKTGLGQFSFWYGSQEAKGYFQCCGSGSIISRKSGSGYGSRVLMTKKWKKELKFFVINKQIEKKASLRAVKATGEVFSLQKRTSSTSKGEIYQLFSIFLGHFCPLGS